jgi:CubicO group peptidase (beta-lactamase class C family)
MITESKSTALGFGNLLRRVTTVTLALLVSAGCGLMRQGNAATPNQVTDKEMETFLQAHLATGEFMGSVLVARGDEVLHSGGYGMANLEHDVPNTPETVFRLASLTKQFTAAAILQLLEQGLLDINDPVDRHLPDYPHGGEITIYQLLNHTSGVPDYEFLEPSMAFRNAVSLDELMAKFSSLPLDFPPGSQFKYSNSGYVVLAAIIEKVSGKGYVDYLSEHIFQPLGMETTRYDSADVVLPDRATGYTWDNVAYQNAEFFDMSNVAGAGDLVSTVLDMYKWDRALFSEDVLSDSSRQAFFTPTATMEEGIGYTYGGAVLEISGRNYTLFSGDINGFFATALRYPEEEIYVIVLSNLRNPSVQAVALGLAAIALDDPYEIPGQHIVVDVDPAIYEKYVGRYQVAPDEVVTIITENSHLFVQVPNQPKFEILPESETDFFAEIGGTNIELHFQVTEDGAVTGMIVLSGGQEVHAEKIN